MTTTTPRISRRAFLRGAAATLIAVAGGTVYRAADQSVFSAGQGPAFAPWTTWRSDAAEGPIALVRAGILAANPHNTQPWLFRVGADSIDLYANTRRNIGAVDPFLREMYMGLGAALENMLLAAEAQGYAATLALAPGVAQPSALYAAIPSATPISARMTSPGRSPPTHWPRLRHSTPTPPTCACCGSPALPSASISAT